MRAILIKLGKYLATLALALLIIVAAAIPLARLEQPGDLLAVDNRTPIAVDNVHLVTMSGEGLLMNRQILIREGRIDEIRSQGGPVSEEFRRIDGQGAYLSPGLFDMHVHAFDRKYLALTLAHGVTSVRNMGGYPMHLRWKAELAGGQWLGSNLFTASPILNGKKNANPLAHQVVTDPHAAVELVGRYHRQGSDFIKVYTRLDPEVYAAIVDEAGRLDLPVAGHVPYPVVEKDYRLASPMLTLEHTEEIFQGPLDYEYDDDALAAVAQDLLDMNATVTPTLMIFDHLTRIARHKQAYIDELPLEYLNGLIRFFEDRTSGARWLGAGNKLADNLEKRSAYFQHITRVLHDAGVNLVLGSDSGIIYAVPGLATHDEIALLQDAGLPAVEILKMATINAARILRIDDRFGSIEVGKVADLVMTTGNPLTNPDTLRAPIAVVKSGQWLDQRDLQSLLESAKQPSNAYFTFGRILEFVVFG